MAAMLKTRILLMVVGVASCTQRANETAGGTHTPQSAISLEVIDTLRAGDHAVLAKPIWISRDRGGTYAVVDGSDKDIKLYDAAGTALGSIGGPGLSDGQFRQLISGGFFRDSAYGYDFATQSVTLFGKSGAYGRTLQLPGPPNDPMPSSVRPVDDSLFLIVGFTPGADSKDLVKLVRADGTVRSTLFGRRGPYSAHGATPELVQLTHAVADGRDGVIYVGVYGSDSLFAFDYDGHQLAAGVVTTDHGTRLPEFKQLLDANHGGLRRPDGRLINSGIPTLDNITAVDRWHAIVEISTADFAEKAELDPTRGGVLLVVARDSASDRLRTEADTSVDRGLLGRDAAGNALTLRYLDELGSTVEVSRIRLVPATTSPTVASRGK